MNTILKEQLAREEGFEEGVQVGEQRGRKEGIEIGEINATIKLCREFGFEEDKIMMKLIKDFNLTEEKAKEYLDGKIS